MKIETMMIIIFILGLIMLSIYVVGRRILAQDKRQREINRLLGDPMVYFLTLLEQVYDGKFKKSLLKKGLPQKLSIQYNYFVKELTTKEKEELKSDMENIYTKIILTSDKAPKIEGVPTLNRKEKEELKRDIYTELGEPSKLFVDAFKEVVKNENFDEYLLLRGLPEDICKKYNYFDNPLDDKKKATLRKEMDIIYGQLKEIIGTEPMKKK